MLDATGKHEGKTMPKKDKKDVYQVITDRMIEQLEKGTIPWRKGWKALSGKRPQNYTTKKPYRGMNAILTACQGYSSPYWITAKQAKDRGGQLKEEHKGNYTPIIKWNWVYYDANGNKVSDRKKAAKTIPFLRFYQAYNAEQVEGIEWEKIEEVPLNEHEKLDQCQEVIDGYPSPPKMEEGGDQPCYVPLMDTVRMPQMGQFDKSEEYYATMFHELVHSTGHKSRLGRLEKQKSHKFGSDCYSKEELVAEMGAAFLSASCQITDETFENAAGYIQNWLGKLKGDSKLVVMAAAQAQKAVDHILDYKPEQKEEK